MFLKMVPIVCIVGKSGSGKTTLIEKLIPELSRKGFRVGTIKHDVHGFEMDHPGKDSWRHKHAGACMTVISSPDRIGMIMDVDHDNTLSELSPFFRQMDIVLTEGFKRENRPKVEIFRPEVHDRPLCRSDRHLIALVTDSETDLGVPRFSTANTKGLARFLADFFSLHKDRPNSGQE